ncbi:PAS domain-containing protein [candidate division GN15 bacterium]|nr:PAS domain-containing protein [candidate division GN15 bacterium]
MITGGRHDPPVIPTSVLVILVLALAAAVLILTWVSIRDSREDSFELLVEQGVAFSEALAEACENAIVAGTYFDRLAEERYSDLAAILAEEPLDDITEERLIRFVRVHELLGAYVYGMDSTLVAASASRAGRLTPPEWVEDEIFQLMADPETPFVLLIDQDQAAGDAIHYFIALSNRLDRVTVLATYAHYHTLAMERTGIGYLVQNMAREQGVEYIIYQSPDGIIFSSKKTGALLAIESDPFLTEALSKDTVSHRVYDFQGKNVLELVRPFATEQFPIGLFRVGLSLDKYYSISRGFDQRMVLLAIGVFAFLLVVLMYLRSRHRRRELSRAYSEIKSLTDRLFEDMRTGVAAVDTGGRITVANEAFAAILERRDLIGKRWDEVVAEERLSFDSFMRSDREADESEVTLNIGDTAKTLLVVRSRLDAGAGAAMAVVAYDITKYREVERQSQRRERLSELGNLAAGVAHEIRNPLNTISIAAQRLAAEFTPTDNAEGYREFTSAIRSETARLNEIITRFLALAREERRRQERVDVGAVIDATRKLIAPEAEKLSIAVTTEVADGLIVTADPDRLKQVMLNLFNNAKEALAGQPGEVRITADRADQLVRIRVADSGPGIPADQRDRVFTPYFTTKEAGTGLGLPAVHSIVTELGGEVMIEDSELGGAAIVVTLPLAQEQS